MPQRGEGQLQLTVGGEDVASPFQDLGVGDAVRRHPAATLPLFRPAQRSRELGVHCLVIALRLRGLSQPVVRVGLGRGLAQPLGQSKGLFGPFSSGAGVALGQCDLGHAEHELGLVRLDA